MLDSDGHRNFPSLTSKAPSLPIHIIACKVIRKVKFIK